MVLSVVADAANEDPPTVKLPLTLTFKLSNVMVFVPDPELNPSPAFMV